MLRYWIFGFVWLSVACSGEDDPPLVTKRPDGGETGGRGAEGGEGSSTGGSTSGRGGNGGTGGSGNTGGLGRPDPEEIYVLGSLEPGLPEPLALCHWTDFDEYVAGFEDLDVYKTTAGEQGLIYQVFSSRTEIRRFVPDLESSLPLESITYPEDPMANDPIIAELECQGGGLVLDFVVGPGDRILYRCTGTIGTWWENGEVLFVEEGFAGDMESLGTNAAFFTETQYEHSASIVTLATGDRIRVLADIVAQDVGGVVAVRAISRGFLVATSRDLDPDPNVYDPAYELWEVGEDGEASLAGTYDGPGGGFTSRLDADGTLYSLNQLDIIDKNSVLTRQVVGGTAEVVYSDLEPSNVYTASLSLVTGP